ncbi:Uncharacterised protein [Mycobacteroides abscessus subsp. abscessus]|nr:Uncharacterised protein [Mycobacteroides abscessus subsp. abscessus]
MGPAEATGAAAMATALTVAAAAAIMRGRRKKRLLDMGFPYVGRRCRGEALTGGLLGAPHMAESPEATVSAGSRRAGNDVLVHSGIAVPDRVGVAGPAGPQDQRGCAPRRPRPQGPMPATKAGLAQQRQ